MDRFLCIQAFVRVAETQSFATAARQLGVTPSVSVDSVDGGPQNNEGGIPGVQQVIADNTVESELDLEDLIGLAHAARMDSASAWLHRFSRQRFTAPQRAT